MAEDTGYNIKRFMEYALWTETWISNGCFAAKKMGVKLGTHFTSSDAVRCAFPNAETVLEWTDEKMAEAFTKFTGPRVEFKRSPWQHQNAALFLDDAGNAAWFNVDYCSALKIEVLYGPAPMFSKPDDRHSTAYFNAPALEDATVVIMPMKAPVDWDQVARAVAAATSVEEPEASTLADIPAPAPQNVAEALMDDLQNPDSESAQLFAKNVAEHGGAVTISVNGRSATFGEESTQQ